MSGFERGLVLVAPKHNHRHTDALDLSAIETELFKKSILTSIFFIQTIDFENPGSTTTLWAVSDVLVDDTLLSFCLIYPFYHFGQYILLHQCC